MTTTHPPYLQNSRFAESKVVWIKFAEGMWKTTGVGVMKEVVRRWKLLRKVLLRAQNSKMAAGWNKWLEVYRIMRARSQRHVWVRMGDELFKRTGLGVFKEVLRRWKLLRLTLLRCANSKLASGWNKWREVVWNIRWVQNRRVWIHFAEFVFKKTGVGLMRELVRRWKLLRRTLMRAANSKLAAGWTTWKNDMLEARRAKWCVCACVSVSPRPSRHLFATVLAQPSCSTLYPPLLATSCANAHTRPPTVPTDQGQTI